MHIAIIGGGAAGMMCAARLAEHTDHQITLLEKNTRLGAKVLISGGGRCNLTTGIYRSRELLTHYTRGAHVAKTVFKHCSPKKVRQRFEDHGVRTKEESDRRVFPLSDDGSEVVGAFEKIFSQTRVTVRMGEWVQSVHHDGEQFVIRSASGTYQADRLIIATGGNAYSHTGSTGDGYAFARSLGHTITPLGPSLNSFITTDQRLHKLSGIAFENATIHRQNQSYSAPVLLTHFGISGPWAFVLASHAAFEKVDQTHPLRVRLQLHADRDPDRWEAHLLEISQTHPRKSLSNILRPHLPNRMVDYLLNHLQLDGFKTLGILTRDDRQRLTKLLGDGIPLEIIGRKPWDEFVTAGGVSTHEIDHQTLESTIVPWLYFAGEVLDVDGVTGWYNLQRCRASGYVVATDIASES